MGKNKRKEVGADEHENSSKSDKRNRNNFNKKFKGKGKSFNDGKSSTGVKSQPETAAVSKIQEIPEWIYKVDPSKLQTMVSAFSTIGPQVSQITSNAENHESANFTQPTIAHATQNLESRGLQMRELVAEANTLAKRAQSSDGWIQNLFKGKLFLCDGLKKFNKSTIMADTGASRFMTSDISLFDRQSLKDVENEYVYLGDDSPIQIRAKGTVRMQLGNHERLCTEALYVPGLVDTLLSVTHLLEKTNDLVVFSADRVYLYVTRERKMITVGKKVGNLYYLDVEFSSPSATTVAHVARAMRSQVHNGKNYLYWHYLLNHANSKVVCETLDAAGISYNFLEQPPCIVCKLINFRRPGTRRESAPAKRFLEVIATDMFPLPKRVWNGAHYCQFVIDRYSKFAWVIWLAKKSDFASEFISLCKTLETKYGKSIITIHGDSGELKCNEIKSFCQSHEPNRIDLKLSPAHTQALNGRTERPLGIYRERAMCALTVSRLPFRFFNFAMDHTIYVGRFLVNASMPNRKTPYELATDTPPVDTLKYLYPFGCLVAVFVPKSLRNQLRIPPLHKAELGIYLGNKTTRLYYIYKYRTKTVHTEFYVQFLPHIFPGLNLDSSLLSRFHQGNLFETADSQQFEGDWDAPFATEDEQNLTTELESRTDNADSEGTTDTQPVVEVPKVPDRVYQWNTESVDLENDDDIEYEGELLYNEGMSKYTAY